MKVMWLGREGLWRSCGWVGGFVEVMWLGRRVCGGDVVR